LPWGGELVAMGLDRGEAHGFDRGEATVEIAVGPGLALSAGRCAAETEPHGII
jgi:hypothetical protein